MNEDSFSFYPLRLHLSRKIFDRDALPLQGYREVRNSFTP